MRKAIKNSPSDSVIVAINRILEELPNERKTEANNLKEYLDSGGFERDCESYMKKSKIFGGITDNLDNAEMQEIVSIMHVGRGDFSTFLDAYKWNIPHKDRREIAISYILSKSPLKLYLKRGLEKITQKK